MVCTWAIAGFTGAGKTFALNFIKELDLKKRIFSGYIDLDLYIEKNFEHPKDYIEKKGFLKFRELETECLIKIFENKTKLLISLGGGTLSQHNFELLKTRGINILGINSEFESCYERILKDDKRPITRLNDREILKLFQERKKIWAKSDYILDNNRDLASFKEALKYWYSCQYTLNS